MDAKNIIAVGLLLFFAFCCVEKGMAQVADLSTYDTDNTPPSFPMNLEGEVIYFEKFEPIYFQDIEGMINKIKLRGDSLKFRSTIGEILEAHNKLLYRQYNDELIEYIHKRGLVGKVVPIFPRDLEEMETPRFVIRNNMNLLTAMLEFYESDSSKSVEKHQFYLHDTRSNTEYRKFDEIKDIVGVTSAYFYLEEKDKLESMDRETFEKQLRYRRGPGSSPLKKGVLTVAVAAVAVLYYGAGLGDL